MGQYKEISSSDSGDELLASSHERRRQRKYSLSSIFFSGTLAGSFCFNVILLFLLWRATEHSYSGPSARRLAEEVNGLVPKVPLKTVVFNQDPNFVPYDRNMTYLEKDRLVSTNWKQAFMPHGRGFITVDHPENYILTTPLATPNGSTVNMEKKDQQYGSRDKLEAYQESKYHHPVETWKRRYHADRPPGWKFDCLYCNEADVDERFSTFKMNDLITHIMESTADTKGELHDQLKAADGWYTPEFENATVTGPSQRTIEKREAEGRKKMQQMDIDLTPRRQLLGTEPAEGNRSIVRGSHPPSPLPARYDIDRDKYNQEALANLPTSVVNNQSLD
ncbi:hypothetical protein TI39_contig5893g00001 [Zymoseptoria brevis]|uniref:Uncharacterized protein n=1 Tax=Zymoseptoria brevis TaxID=1047168 RepID=A0A0F4G4D2_9PEZI|nr:hypothetical protein TI39_contig5893g00001 [Zymoseptoria brevis]